ncbi:MAG: response regulator [Candidatus Omnitrophica bacterium]|nr:response regulator [Candidatus Omnitrophota bacterium]
MGKAIKLLIVDDDPVLLRMAQERFKQEGFTPIVAQEAAEGLQIAMAQTPDLIVLDVMMPIINGYNFCRLLKSDAVRKNIPVIFLTSRDTAQDVQFGKESGADAYLTKPVNFDLLLQKIYQLLPRES